MQPRLSIEILPRHPPRRRHLTTPRRQAPYRRHSPADNLTRRRLHQRHRRTHLISHNRKELTIHPRLISQPTTRTRRHRRRTTQIQHTGIDHRHRTRIHHRHINSRTTRRMHLRQRHQRTRRIGPRRRLTHTTSSRHNRLLDHQVTQPAKPRHHTRRHICLRHPTTRMIIGIRKHRAIRNGDLPQPIPRIPPIPPHIRSTRQPLGHHRP